MGWMYAAIYHHRVRQKTVEANKTGFTHKEQHIEVQLAHFTWLSPSLLLQSRAIFDGSGPSRHCCGLSLTRASLQGSSYVPSELVERGVLTQFMVAVQASIES